MSVNSSTAEKAKKDRLFETVCMYALMAGFAVFTTIVGAILLMLVEEFGLPLTRGGDFVAAQNIGSLLGILLSGFLIDRYRKHNLIFMLYILFSASIIAVFFSATLAAFLGLLAFAGLATKMIDLLLNAGISELHTVNKGFYMNLLHCCYGVGSFLGPIYAGAVAERFGEWRLSFLLLGCFCLALALVYGTFLARRRRQTAVRQAAAIKTKTPASFASIAGLPMLACALILFCYSGHQIGMNNWFPSFMSDNAGADQITAGFGLSVFWLGLIAGRLVCSILTRRCYEKHLLAAGNALGGLAILLGVFLGGEAFAFASAAAVGFLAGATIPMALTLAYTWHPEAQGKVSMAMFIAITIGGAVGPWAMGKLVDGANLTRAMQLNALMLLAAAALAIALPGKTSKVE